MIMYTGLYYREKEKQDLRTKINELEEYKKKYEEEKKENEVKTQVLINKKIQRKLVNIFLLMILAYVLGAQKNRLIEKVLLSTHNICFGWEIRK